ncbi:MAG: helix-turn-helix transcriptional regulator [Bosea sp.]|uniref:helix-turn-helix domain-containing protein n=1 Tax=unclassified Bosea (in: a-proteobacteria) TaxID=2653178 RepID=UPI001ACB2312|nr:MULTISPECIES: helix-turn-helix transcriptional regulator [unclassified Bosea (in: a-proteobacteria)]MBN9458120.1 helix-turn-helix transcriptional regulator [Bosea sp. (in: a-proteobacteria)]
MDARTRVAWNLRRLRVERGLSQENLAVDADVDRSYISGMERQEFNPTVDLLDRLAAALDVDVGRLLEPPDVGAEAPKPLKSGRRPK